MSLGVVLTRAGGRDVRVARCERREVLVRLTVNGADVEVDDGFATSPPLWVPRDVLTGRRMTRPSAGG